jgi:hypothetical protein
VSSAYGGLGGGTGRNVDRRVVDRRDLQPFAEFPSSEAKGSG